MVVGEVSRGGALDQVDRIFHALADPTRRDIVPRVLEGTRRSRPSRAYPMSFAAVQKHVAVLERAGLVTKERRGREQLVTRTSHHPPGRRRLLDRRGRLARPHGPLRASSPTPTERNRQTTTMTSRASTRTSRPGPDAHVAEFEAPRRAGLGAVGRPAQARAVVGPAHLPGDLRTARPRRPAGGSRYYMTGPDGEKARGWWRFSADEPRHLEFEDGFSDESGLPNPQMPTRPRSGRAGGDRCGHPDDGHVAVRHRRADGQLVPMGMVEGMTWRWARSTTCSLRPDATRRRRPTSGRRPRFDRSRAGLEQE